MRYDYSLLQADAELYRKTSDEAAFRRIETAIRGYIFTVTARVWPSVQEDVRQQLLLAVVQMMRSPSWRPKEQPFSGMFRKAVNDELCRYYRSVNRYCRRGELTTVSLERATSAATASFEDDVLSRVVVQTALEELNPRDRRAAEFILQGGSIDAAARCVGITGPGLKRRLAKVLPVALEKRRQRKLFGEPVVS